MDLHTYMCLCAVRASQQQSQWPVWSLQRSVCVTLCSCSQSTNSTTANLTTAQRAAVCQAAQKPARPAMPAGTCINMHAPPTLAITDSIQQKIEFSEHIKEHSFNPLMLIIWWCVNFSLTDSGKTQEGDKFIPAAPSSPLRKQEVENLRWGYRRLFWNLLLTHNKNDLKKI